MPLGDSRKPRESSWTHACGPFGTASAPSISSFGAAKLTIRLCETLLAVHGVNNVEPLNRGDLVWRLACSIREGKWTCNAFETLALGGDPPTPFDDCGADHQGGPQQIAHENAYTRVGVDQRAE